MPGVEFEPTIPVFERAKTFHALDCAATMIGRITIGPVIYFTFRVSLYFIIVIEKWKVFI
jgi:hypothetical protein